MEKETFSIRFKGVVYDDAWKDKADMNMFLSTVFSIDLSM